MIDAAMDSWTTICHDADALNGDDMLDRKNDAIRYAGRVDGLYYQLR